MNKKRLQFLKTDFLAENRVIFYVYSLATRFGLFRYRANRTEPLVRSLIARRFAKLVFSQNGEDLLLAQILFRDFELAKSRLRGQWYCDVGAFHPYEHSNSALFRGLGIKGLHVDPSRQTGREFYLLAPSQTFRLGFAGQGETTTRELFVPSAQLNI